MRQQSQRASVTETVEKLEHINMLKVTITGGHCRVALVSFEQSKSEGLKYVVLWTEVSTKEGLFEKAF